MPRVEVLRAAPSDIPAWAERYTQLPDLPPRVHDLSASLTQGRRTAFDKAVAVEHFLRQLPPSRETWPVPAGHDTVDHVLFETREGDAQQLAFAMVVLLRAQGIPTRLSTGYASDQYDDTSGKLLVTEGDVHAWPEVYFDSYSWVSFEPSGEHPPILRLQGTQDAPSSESMDCDLLGEWSEACNAYLTAGAYVDLLSQRGDALLPADVSQRRTSRESAGVIGNA